MRKRKSEAPRLEPGDKAGVFADFHLVLAGGNTELDMGLGLLVTA